MSDAARERRARVVTVDDDYGHQRAAEDRTRVERLR